MRKKYEVRRVGKEPPHERWLATFREWGEANEYVENRSVEGFPPVVEIVEVWDDN